MKSTKYLFLFYLLFWGCNQNNKKIEYYENGNVKLEYYHNDSMKMEGPFIAYYSNGNKLSEGKMENDFKSGKWTIYHPSGKIEAEGNYAKDLKLGKWVYYDEINSKSTDILWKNFTTENLSINYVDGWNMIPEDSLIKPLVIAFIDNKQSNNLFNNNFNIAVENGLTEENLNTYIYEMFKSRNLNEDDIINQENTKINGFNCTYIEYSMSNSKGQKINIMQSWFFSEPVYRISCYFIDTPNNSFYHTLFFEIINSFRPSGSSKL